MKNQTPEKQNHIYSVQQEALVQRLSKLGFFVGLETGFIDYQTNGTLNMLSAGTLVSVMPAVKACYFMPDPGEDDGLYSSVIGLLYDLAHDGIGIYSCS